MEEVKRIDTTSKGKKSTTILLIFAGILGIALIGVAMYLYTQTNKDTTEPGASTSVTCGCYFIDPLISPECVDSRRGFMFQATTVPSSQTCQASCSTNTLLTEMLNSPTKQDQYQVCFVQNILDSRCTGMVIKNEKDKIVTGRVDSNEKLTIEALFDSEYTNHKFIVNNQYLDPTFISPDKLTTRIEVADLSADTVTITATAEDKNGNSIESPLCRRLIEINQTGVSNVAQMSVQTRRDLDFYKISKIKIDVGNITEDDNITLKFLFDNENLNNLLMNEGFVLDSSRGQISIIEQDLYDTNNFDKGLSFAQFDGKEGSFEITSEVKRDNITIGTANTNFDLPSMPSLDEPSPDGEAEESDFTITKSSSLECIERVSPNNTIDFTITIRNNSSIPQGIESIKDKLPLGFKYIEGSTKLDGTPMSDSDFVKVTKIGESQEVVFEKDDEWEIPPGVTVSILFESLVGQDALTGSNQNEVVLAPKEVPLDPSTLRAELVVLVAQNCEEPDAVVEEEDEIPTEDDKTPETGIFDTILIRIIVGILMSVIGWYIYSRPVGQMLVEKFTQSKIFEQAEVTSWRIFKPKKYFEAKIIKGIDKKKKKG